MLGHSRLTYLASLLLLSPAFAATYYRMTPNPPVQVKASGGFVANDPDGTGSVIDHAHNRLGNEDPWISTTPDKEFLKKSATYPGNAYIYTINTSGLGEIADVQKAFDDAHEENPHPAEKEQAVKKKIPWENIVEWDVYTRSKYKKTVTREAYDKDPAGNSKKREIPFTA